MSFFRLAFPEGPDATRAMLRLQALLAVNGLGSILETDQLTVLEFRLAREALQSLYEKDEIPLPPGVVGRARMG